MFNPPHPGLTLRDDVLPELGIGASKAAELLGVSRVALSRVLNGRAAISAELALRLELWLGAERGGDASIWLGMQNEYDLWQVAQRMADKPLPLPVENEVPMVSAVVSGGVVAFAKDWTEELINAVVHALAKPHGQVYAQGWAAVEHAEPLEAIPYARAISRPNQTEYVQ